jgi:DNA (cytosine-5)-methyltransferase 1
MNISMEKTSSDAWRRGTPVEANVYNWDGEPFVIPRDRPLSSAPVAVDLFCGCGGFSTGFEMAGFQSALGADIHPPSVKTFTQNHPAASMIVGDMRKVSDNLVVDAVGAARVDLVAAGVPCQGFSLNNRKRWDRDERNFLFREFIRVVHLLQPRVVLLENVSGLRSAANGEFVTAIEQAIADAGYRVRSTLLNAADYGVPQRRRRVFFLGVRPDLDLWFPIATHPAPEDHVTVWEAIGDLPQIGAAESSTRYGDAPFSDYQRLMRAGWSQLYNHVAPAHPPEVIEKISRTTPGSPIYPRFKQRIRLHPDKPSPTQVSGGIRPQFQFGHPKMARGLTIRERCRLQSFPDRYEISGGIVQGRVQTGNAVPPLLASALGREILRAIRGEGRPLEAPRLQNGQLSISLT